MALIGTALANKRTGKHIITTCFEHSSVHEPLIYLENQGYEFVKISDLIMKDHYHMDVTGKQIADE